MEAEIEELELQIEELKGRNLASLQIDNSRNAMLDPVVADLLFSQSQSQKQAARPKRLSKKTKQTLEQIQLENIERMFGITTFKIANDTNGQMLGVRFDTFNNFLKQYQPPHYLILRQEQVKEQAEETSWTVFKSTLPKYISVGDAPLNDQDSIIDFCLPVHDQLEKIETKRSMCLSLRNMVYELAQGQDVTVKFDLNVYKCTITILNKVELIVLMDLDSVLSCIVVDDERKITPDQKRAIEQMIVHTDDVSQLDSICLQMISKIQAIYS